MVFLIKRCVQSTTAVW